MKRQMEDKSDFPLWLLEKAAWQCTRNVCWKNDVAKWRSQDRLKYLIRLKKELDSGTYRLGKYKEFVITEPKRRLIHSPLFRDRVVQRAMCINGVYDELMKDSILDSCACQNGKGVYFAMKRMELHLRRHFHEHGLDGNVVKLDIRHFFQSIPHAGLHDLVDRKVSNPHYRSLVHEVIDSFSDPGIGLGSQMCQLLANAYLNPYDHFAKEKLKCRGYIRYSDDIVMIFNANDNALDAMRKSNLMLSGIDLELNKKSSMHEFRQGVKFLKFHFIFRHGRILRIASKTASRRYARHFKKLLECGVDSWHLAASLDSWESRMRQGHNKTIIHNLRRRFQKCIK